MRFIFWKHIISLVERRLGTADDHVACGIEDLHVQALEGGLAVHAVNVVSSGTAGNVEAIDMRGNIDGGDNFSAGGGSGAVRFKSDHDVLASKLQVAGRLDIDLVRGLVIVEEVGHQVLLDINSPDDDLGRTGGGRGDELLVDLHEVLELDQLAGVRVHGSADRGCLDQGVSTGVDSLNGAIGGLDGGISVQSHWVPGVLGIVIGGDPIGVLRSRKGGGDEGKKTEHVSQLVS